jgi:hypothetical protein
MNRLEQKCVTGAERSRIDSDREVAARRYPPRRSFIASGGGPRRY